MTVEFTSTAAQSYSGTLTVISDKTSGTNTIAISGTGTTSEPAQTVDSYHVWGGSTYSQYLGFYSCFFCSSYDPDSINNEYGTYGFEYSNYSPCNEYATSPPRVYNSDRSVYYGELTLNEYRPDALNHAVTVGWLKGDVCNH